MIERTVPQGLSPRSVAVALAALLVATVSPLRILADDARCAELLESAPLDEGDVWVALEVLETCPKRYRLEVLDDETEFDPFFSLDELDAESAGKALGRVLRYVQEEPDPWLAHLTGVDLWEWLDESDALGRIFEVLLDHRAPGVRAGAVVYFGESEGHLKTLREIWPGETDPDVLIELIDALSFEDIGMPGIEDLMWHSDPRLAGRAIGVVAYDGGEDRYLRLIDRASSGPSDLRKFALYELSLVVGQPSCDDCYRHELDEETLLRIERLASSIWDTSADPGLRSAVMDLYAELDGNLDRALSLARGEVWEEPGPSSASSVFVLSRSDAKADRELLLRLASEAKAATRAEAISALAATSLEPRLERVLKTALAPGQPRIVRSAALSSISGDESMKVLRIMAGVDPAPGAPEGDPTVWEPRHFEANVLARYAWLDEENRIAAGERLDRARFILPLLRQLAGDDPEAWVRESAAASLSTLLPEEHPAVTSQGIEHGTEVDLGEPGLRVLVSGESSERCLAGPGHERISGGLRVPAGTSLPLEQRFHDGERPWASIVHEDRECWLPIGRHRIEAGKLPDFARGENRETGGLVTQEIDLPRERVATAAFATLAGAEIAQTFDPGEHVVGVRLEVDPEDNLQLSVLKAALSLRDTPLEPVVAEVIARRAALGLETHGWEGWTSPPDDPEPIDPSLEGDSEEGSGDDA